MSHIRKQIRDHIVTTVTGLGATGNRVYKTRVYPLAASQLSGLCVYTKNESIEYGSITYPRTQIRVLEVIVEGYAINVANIDDTLDTISQQVEEALATDVTRGGLAKDTQVTSFEADFSGEGEKPVGICRLTVEVTYSLKENEVETAV
jgi:hypothetical protein